MAASSRPEWAAVGLSGQGLAGHNWGMVVGGPRFGLCMASAVLLSGCFYDPTGSDLGSGTAQTVAEVTSGGGSTGGGAPTTGIPDPVDSSSTGEDPGTSTGSSTTTVPADPTTTDVDPGSSSSTTSDGSTGTTTSGEDSSSGEASTTGGCTEQPFFKDSDMDGYGDPEQFVLACEQPATYRLLPTNAVKIDGVVAVGKDL